MSSFHHSKKIFDKGQNCLGYFRVIFFGFLETFFPAIWGLSQDIVLFPPNQTNKLDGVMQVLWPIF